MIGNILTIAVCVMILLAIGILAYSRDNIDEEQGTDRHDDNITD